MDYWNIYKDVWNFHKKYADVKEDDAYWESVVNESSRIAKQYGDSKFVIGLLLTVIEELERIYNYGIKKKENIVYISTEWKKRR